MKAGAPPATEPVEVLGESPDHARLLLGDALDVARALAAEGLSGKVDCIYLDPPFASQADYVHEARLDGRADGRVVRTLAYEDTWAADAGMGAYLDFIGARLEAMAALLAPHGTLWVHLDWRAAYLVRALLDELLGREAFKNEIVWRRAPNLGRQAASHQFGRTLDTLLVYGGHDAKLAPPTRLEPIEPSAIRWDDAGRPFTTAPRGDYTDASIARLEKEGRVHRTPSGKVYIKYFLVRDAAGVLCRERRVDALWTDVPPLRHVAVSERTGFPTQKPRGLLERIVASATPAGGLVVDLFSGSGTTAEAARALGRRAIAGDASPLAIATARARLARAGHGVSVERCGAGADALADGLEVDARRVEANMVEIDLVAPRDVLAWAVDFDRRDDRPFRAAWHSERQPGARTRPALLSARGAVGPSGRVAVRAYADDGRVFERALTTAELLAPRAAAGAR